MRLAFYPSKENMWIGLTSQQRVKSPYSFRLHPHPNVNMVYTQHGGLAAFCITVGSLGLSDFISTDGRLDARWKAIVISVPYTETSILWLSKESSWLWGTFFYFSYYYITGYYILLSSSKCWEKKTVWDKKIKDTMNQILDSSSGNLECPVEVFSCKPSI